jgi:hypothetical protein
MSVDDMSIGLLAECLKVKCLQGCNQNNWELNTGLWSEYVTERGELRDFGVDGMI